MIDLRAYIPEPIKYWLRITHGAINLWLDRNAFSYAGSLAFYTLFSLAPTVIIAVTVIGLVLGEDAARGQIVAQLQETIGYEAASAVEQAVAKSQLKETGFIPTILGIGALLTGATMVFAQMQFSLNTIWGVTAKPSRSSIFIFLKSRVLSLAVVVSIGFVLLVSLLLGVILRAAMQMVDSIIPIAETLFGGAELLVSLVMIAALFAIIFRVLPDVTLRWKDVAVGALVTAVLFSVGRYGIAVYLAYTATASTYGAAGSVVIILLWVYYSSLILLFGAAFTRVHFETRGEVIRPRNTAVRVRHELLDTGELR